MDKILHHISPNQVPYVVRIMYSSKREGLKLLGSGIIINPDVVLTCWHVVQKFSPDIDNVVIHVNKENEPISFLNFKRHENSDIVALYLKKSIFIEPPTLLYNFEPYLSNEFRKHTFPIFGYKARDNGKQLRRCDADVWMPEYCEHSEHQWKLWEVQVQGGIPAGNSGGAILMHRDGNIACLGMVFLGSDPAATSRIISSDLITEFLENTLKLQPKRVAEAKGFFPLPPQKPSAEQFVPSPAPTRLLPKWALLCVVAALALSAGGGAYKYYQGHLQHNAEPLPPSILPTKSAYDVSRERPGVCVPSQIPRIFNATPGVHILVLRLRSRSRVESAEAQSGEGIAIDIVNKLDSFKREQEASPEWTSVKLNADNLHIDKYPCEVATHNAAREVGQAAGADIVLWGDWEKDGKHPGELLSLFITGVKWPTLTSKSLKPTSLSSVRNIHNLALPQIASEELWRLFEMVLGTYTYQNGRYELAAQYFRNITKESLPNRTDAAELLSMAGMSRLYSNDKHVTTRKEGEDVITILNSALAHCPVDDTTCQARQNAELSFAYMYQDDFTNAERYAAEAQKVTLPSGEDDTYIDMLLMQMSIKAGRNDYVNIEENIQLVEKLTKSSKHPRLLVNANNELGLLYQHERKYQLAHEQFSQALSQTTCPQDTTARAALLNNQGHALRCSQRWDEAQDVHAKALSDAKLAGAKKFEFQAHLGLAESLYFKGLTSEAQQHYQEAAKLGLAADDGFSVGLVHARLCDILLTSNRQRAKQECKIAISHLKDLPTEHYAKALVNLSSIYGERNEFPQAFDNLNIAYSICLQTGCGFLDRIMVYRAEAALNMKRYDIVAQDGINTAIHSYKQGNSLLAERFLASALRYAIKGELSESIANIIKAAKYLDEGFSLHLQARQLYERGRHLAAWFAYSDLISYVQNRRYSSIYAERLGSAAASGLVRLHLGGKIAGCEGLAVVSAEQPTSQNPNNLSYLQIGDIILSYREKCLDTIENFDQLKKQHELSQQSAIKLRVWRRGEILDIVTRYRFVASEF